MKHMRNRTGLACAVVGALTALAAERMVTHAPTAIARGDSGATQGNPGPFCPGDNNNDRRIDAADLSVLLANFGTVCPIDNDRDGWTPQQGDCNDNNPNINPGAPEICGNGIDDDCDGLVDQQDPQCNSPLDNDGDGWTVQQGDCNDNNPNVYPGAPEICGNGIDDDCDALTDQADPQCAGTDNDHDGWTAQQGDCNDNNPNVYPGANENCSNGIDDDCDGLVDMNDPQCGSTIDNDGDGFTIKQGDCNDNDPSVNPGAQEICGNGVDDNCNGLVDAKDPGCVSNPCDQDADGYTLCDGDCNDQNPAVNPGVPEKCDNGIDDDCDGLVDAADPDCVQVDNDGDGWTAQQGDCNDADPSVNPGQPENCFNGVDDNCNGLIDSADPACGQTDNDGDGWTVQQGDCNDSNPGIHPGATENCGDGIDNNCNGLIDNADPACNSTQDNDGDGWTPQQGDCNDNNAQVFPGHPEICGNGIDDDCDGMIDEGC